MKYSIQQGLILPLTTRYIKFTKSYKNELIIDDLKTEVKFIEGSSSKDYSIGFNDIELASDILLHETDWYKVDDVSYRIGCVSFIKTTPSDYVFSQYICNDIEEYIINYDETQCTILVPSTKSVIKDIDELLNYIRCFNSIPYLYVESVDIGGEEYKLGNFYCINLSDKCQVHESKNTSPIASNNYYDKFRLRTIDIQTSFLAQFEHLINKRGIQLIDRNRDRQSEKENQISYSITTIDRQINPKNPVNTFNPGLGLQIYEMTIDFIASLPDFVVYENFRRDYENYTFITDWSSFNTKDKYKEKWSSSIWWEPINTDFNHDFSTSDDGNFSYQLNFSCRIRYYVVEDPNMNNIKLINKIILDFNTKDKEGDIITHYRNTIDKSITRGLNDNYIIDRLDIFSKTITKRLYRVNSVTSHGSIDGLGFYAEGDTCMIQCNPSKGWKFDKWSNGSTENPITFVVDKDEILIPILKKSRKNGKVS